MKPKNKGLFELPSFDLEISTAQRAKAEFMEVREIIETIDLSFKPESKFYTEKMVSYLPQLKKAVKKMSKSLRRLHELQTVEGNPI